MSDLFQIMLRPLVACLVLTGIHCYLGIHVVERKVIFVDLALAQIAALGVTIAFLFGYDLEGPETYWFSLAATFFGATVFALTRTRRERIPQEAIIGIVFAVSAAAAALVLSRAPEGDEHLRQILVGNILLVSWPEIIRMALLYSIIGIFLTRFHGVLMQISSRPEEAFRQGIPVRFWDLIFYLAFGLVVTSSVRIAGVLLVFSYLIVPAVCAMLFSRAALARLLLGWAIGSAASLIGTFLSYSLDLPTGATVVCLFGLMLPLIARLFKKKILPES